MWYLDDILGESDDCRFTKQLIQIAKAPAAGLTSMQLYKCNKCRVDGGGGGGGGMRNLFARFGGRFGGPELMCRPRRGAQWASWQQGQFANPRRRPPMSPGPPCPGTGPPLACPEWGETLVLPAPRVERILRFLSIVCIASSTDSGFHAIQSNCFDGGIFHAYESS